MQAADISDDDLSLLAGRDIVLLGEIHDNPDHHAFQARAIAAIAPSAVVFEMLTPDQADAVTPGNRRDPEALSKALNWAETGWPDFAMYAPLFAATDAPVYGAALPRGDVRRAVSDGAAAVFGADSASFGLTTPLPEAEQSAREAGQMASHCDALPPEMLPGMVAAQRLRDAAFARTILAAHDAHGGPVVMITGTGHVRLDWGIPAALATAAPELSVLSVGAFEDFGPPSIPVDHWITATSPDRPDPCDAFRK